MYKRNDLIQELAEYIKKNLKKGYTKESLKWALINQGYSKMEVERALKKTEEDLANEAPILKTKPDITYEVLDSQQKEELGQKKWWQRWFNL